MKRERTLESHVRAKIRGLAELTRMEKKSDDFDTFLC